MCVRVFSDFFKSCLFFFLSRGVTFFWWYRAVSRAAFVPFFLVKIAEGVPPGVSFFLRDIENLFSFLPSFCSYAPCENMSDPLSRSCARCFAGLVTRFFSCGSTTIVFSSNLANAFPFEECKQLLVYSSDRIFLRRFSPFFFFRRASHLHALSLRPIYKASVFFPLDAAVPWSSPFSNIFPSQG